MRCKLQAGATLACILLLLYGTPSEAVMGSMVGGTISWTLDDLFEDNRIIHFRIQTAFDRSDGLGSNTGTILELYQPVAGPGIDHADKFGFVKVEAFITGGDSVVQEFENKFVITFLDEEKDLVHGELLFEFEMPAGSTSATAVLTQKSGSPVTTGINAIGGLPDCNPIGQSQTPCSLNSQADVFIATDPIITLSTSISLPAPSSVSTERGNRILNRNSPVAHTPMVHIITLEDADFPVPAYDLDGDSVRIYTYASTQAAPGALDVVCARDRSVALTQLGCSPNQNTNLEGRPDTLYEGTLYHFITEEPYPKPNYGNPKFYYMLTMLISDGVNSITSLFSMNLCYPTVFENGNDVYLRPPEFVRISGDGSLARERPATTVQCHYRERCAFTLYAAHFANASGLQTTARGVAIEAQGPTHLVNLSSAALQFMQLQPQEAYNGSATNVVMRHVVIGDPTLEFASHLQSDIGRMRVVCFRVRGEASCTSPPLCISVKVVGTVPVFVSPTPPLDLGLPILLNETTEIAVCRGSQLAFTIAAEDADSGDLVSINTFDNGTSVDGVDLFAFPYSASRTGLFLGNTTRAELTVQYLLSESTGVAIDAVTRAQSFPEDRIICSQASDATWEQYLRWGGTSTRNLLSDVKCHMVKFKGPPVFVTGPGNSSTPFGALEGSVEQRAGELVAFIGTELEFTLAAQDPNYQETVDILLLADPGIPNNARLLRRQCHPFTYTQIRGGGNLELVADCSVSSRGVRWAPVASDGGRRRRICATVRDNSQLCAPPRTQDPKATSFGWYGEEHCVDVQVVGAALEWSGERVPAFREEAGRWEFPRVTGHVGCELAIELRARDTAVGNASGAPVPSPYQVRIRQDGEASEEAELEEGAVGREGVAVVRVRVPRGKEGHRLEMCVVAEHVGGAAALPRACVVVAVERCMYCIGTDDTLESVIRDYVQDSNWLRLWAANGNDDGNNVTQTVTHPAQLVDSSVAQPRVLHVGSIYEAGDGDSLSALAALFHTTVKTLLSLNPDVTDPAHLSPGQELCVIPCSHFLNPSWDYSNAY